MEFIFKDLDTSRITGKTYLPIFLNEKASKVYGSKALNLEKEVLLGEKTSGTNGNQAVLAFLDGLYSDVNIYDNYLKFFQKSFTSPLSKTGVNVYNYVLADSAYIENKWCYNIIYYPRRTNELTFKGDFWVNDSTFAVKNINMQAVRSANINWVKEIYIEQEFDVLNDSVFLLKRDYMMSDFSLQKKDKAKGVYGKRTTVYDNYQFDKPKSPEFYKQKPDPYNQAIFERDSTFWETARIEKLNEQELGIFKMLDTLKTVPRFNTFAKTASVLGSGFYEIDKWNIDVGNLYDLFGFNEAEGIRTKLSARTFFTQNDPWRVEGYTAYGFRDKKFKYGLAARVMIDKKNRIILYGGNRRDVEQLGINLTTSNDILGRGIGSSTLVSVGANNRLSNINLSVFNMEIQPITNLTFSFGGTYRTIASALPDQFSLSFINNNGEVQDNVKQFNLTSSILYTPWKKIIRVWGKSI